jgi:hypothetical protein
VTTIDLAAAANNDAVLRNCLGRSPDVVVEALTLRVYKGAPSAGAALNQALDGSQADVLIVAHQDVYLPEGFLAALRLRLTELDASDPNWAIAGVIGQTAAGVLAGRTWSSGLGVVLGAPEGAPIAVEALDEMLLFVRRASGLRFDEQLPGFHLYAADAIQIARARGMRSYVIDAPAVHHSRAVVELGADYRLAYRYMQAKWRSQLPIPNLVCPLKRWPFELWLRDLRIRSRHRGKLRPPEPMDDPSVIARRIGFEPVT